MKEKKGKSQEDETKYGVRSMGIGKNTLKTDKTIFIDYYAIIMGRNVLLKIANEEKKGREGRESMGRQGKAAN